MCRLHACTAARATRPLLASRIPCPAFIRSTKRSPHDAPSALDTVSRDTVNRTTRNRALSPNFTSRNAHAGPPNTNVYYDCMDSRGAIHRVHDRFLSDAAKVVLPIGCNMSPAPLRPHTYRQRDSDAISLSAQLHVHH